YEQAIDLAKRVAKEMESRGGTVILTGHSLGGGLAAAASYATGLDAEVFNPAGLSGRYASGSRGNINSHVTLLDPLSVGRTVLPIFRGCEGRCEVYWPRDWLWTHGMNNFVRE
ncbi:MAG: hypothetical protein ACKOAW_04770, partial [Actinomycetota bacterium]